jgi:hypothetical protein
MTRSRRVSLLPPQALIPAGSSEPPPSSPSSGADRKMAIGVVAVAMLIQMLRSPRFYERAAVAAIGLAALAAVNEEGSAKVFARLIAWAKRQDARLERKVKAAVT